MAAFGSVVAGLSNCGGDDNTTPGVDGGGGTDSTVGGDNTTADVPSGPGSVGGNAIYMGSKKGVIYLGLFSSLPPSIANVAGVAEVTNPKLPGSSPYVITMVAPGNYYLVAEIAAAVMGPPPPPGPTTPVSANIMVTVNAGQMTMQDVMIFDPDGGSPPPDGGMDGAPQDGASDGAGMDGGTDGAGGDASDGASE